MLVLSNSVEKETEDLSGSKELIVPEHNYFRKFMVMNVTEQNVYYVRILKYDRNSIMHPVAWLLDTKCCPNVVFKAFESLYWRL